MNTLNRALQILCLCLLGSFSSFAQGSGQQLFFDGNNDYVACPPPSAGAGTSDFTVELYAKFNSMGTAGLISAFSTSSGGWAIIPQGTNRLAFFVGTSSSTGDWEMVFSPSLSFGRWYHIACVRQGNNLRFYLDGQLVSTGTSSRNLSVGDLYLGTRYNNNLSWHFDGMMDEVRVWDVALTETEIRNWMCRKVNPNHPHRNNLQAYYTFDEGQGETALDRSGNHRDGAFINEPQFQVSETPIGDLQQYSSGVSTGSNLSFNHPDGYNLSVDVTSGSADLLYIYRVDEAPNVGSPPSGWNQLGQAAYFGVKAFGGSPSYTITYDYNGYPGIENESNLGLANRTHNADPTWSNTAATLNTSANTLSQTGQVDGEYILSSSGSDPLSSDIMVSEFLANPTGTDAGYEWIELYNRSSQPVDLQNWRLQDEDGENVLITSSSFVLAPGQYALLVQNQANFEANWTDGCGTTNILQVSGFNLDNTEDEIRLVNANGSISFALAYSDDETEGQSTWWTQAADYGDARSGTKAAPTVVRNGQDADFQMGFEGNTHSPTPSLRTAANGDQGSPSIRYGSNPDLDRGNQLVLDGSNDFVDLAYNPALSNSSFSASIWVYPHSGGSGYRCPLSHRDAINEEGFNFYITPSNNWELWGGLGSGWEMLTGPAVAFDSWTHIGATYDGTTLRFFVNGAEVAQQTASVLPNSSRPIFVGRGESSTTAALYHWDGGLDELRIWNRALSADEMRESMHLSQAACADDLIVYYQFNESSGANTTMDNSGNGHDGSLQNIATASAWQSSSINLGNDALYQSGAQSAVVPTGNSSTDFGSARARLMLNSHSGSESFTCTYQAFTPNSTTGVPQVGSWNQHTWTLSKSTSTETFLGDLELEFPTALLESDEPANYQLYWRPLYSDGKWRALARGKAVISNQTIRFGSIDRVGQFMVVQEGLASVSPVSGSMYSFNGTNQLIRFINSDAHSLTGSQTVEFWVRPDDFSSVPFFFCRFQADRDEAFKIGSNSTGLLQFSSEDPSLTLTGTTTLTAGQWYHVAVTYDGSHIRLYLDGNEENSMAHTGGFGASTGGYTILAADWDASGFNQYLDGAIDELRIWTSARSATDLRAYKHLSLRGDESGLLSYYQFDNDLPYNSLKDVRDAVGGIHGDPYNISSADRIDSEIPLSAGISETRTVNTAGVQNFDEAGISLDFQAAPSADIVVSRLSAAKPHGASHLTGDVDNEYFVINQYGGTAVNVDAPSFLGLHRVSPTDVASPNVFELYQRSSNAFGNSWGSSIGNATSVNTDGDVVFGSTTLSGFSQFVVVNTGSNSNLPVELLDFQAQRSTATQVALNWSTATEINASHFEVERMLDNEEVFTKVGEVVATGNTTTFRSYAFQDANAHQGLSYYRLKQVDEDGSFEYSEIRAVAGKELDRQVTVFPNPVNDVLKLRLSELSGQQQVEVRIVNSLGQVIFQGQRTFGQADVVEIREVASLVPGAYYLQLNWGAEQMALPFVKR